MLSLFSFLSFSISFSFSLVSFFPHLFVFLSGCLLPSFLPSPTPLHFSYFLNCLRSAFDGVIVITRPEHSSVAKWPEIRCVSVSVSSLCPPKKSSVRSRTGAGLGTAWGASWTVRLETAWRRRPSLNEPSTKWKCLELFLSAKKKMVCTIIKKIKITDIKSLKKRES